MNKNIKISLKKHIILFIINIIKKYNIQYNETNNQLVFNNKLDLDIVFNILNTEDNTVKLVNYLVENVLNKITTLNKNYHFLLYKNNNNKYFDLNLENKVILYYIEKSKYCCIPIYKIDYFTIGELILLW